jgi:hypothetical protein
MLSTSPVSESTVNALEVCLSLENESPQVHLDPTLPDPTRYGDWEKAGRCIDF